MLKKILLFGIATLLLIGSNLITEAKSLNNKWDKVFPKSDKINVEKKRIPDILAKMHLKN